jgi:hypothetical protein
MRSFRWTVLSVFCAVTIAGALFAAAGFSQVVPVHAVWMYGFEAGFDNETEVSYLSRMGITQVYLSMGSVSAHRMIDPGYIEYDINYTNSLVDFITRAHDSGISVHAMTLEDPAFTLSENHPFGTGLIDNILSYNQNNPSASFDGIHIDVEPWDPAVWQSTDLSDLNTLLAAYNALLSEVRNRLDIHESATGQKVRFSASVAWWFNEQADDGFLPNGDASLLSTYLDVLVPLVYDDIGDTVDDIVYRVDDEISEAPAVIGVGVHEFSSYHEVANVINGVNAYFSGEQNYLGTSIFEYDLLKNYFISAADFRIAGATPVPYLNLQAALDDADDGDTIQVRTALLEEDLYIDDPDNKSLSLQGGYNSDFTAVTGQTSIAGNVIISNGTVNMSHFMFQ